MDSIQMEVTQESHEHNYPQARNRPSSIKEMGGCSLALAQVPSRLTPEALAFFDFNLTALNDYCIIVTPFFNWCRNRPVGLSAIDSLITPFLDQ